MPKLEAFFGAVRKEIVDGKGFILFKGVPVREWGAFAMSNNSVILKHLLTSVSSRLQDCRNLLQRTSLWFLLTYDHLG